MTPFLDPTLRRVAVFRALQLGDMLCAVPALRALRRALPGAAVTLVGLRWASELARRFPGLVDEALDFPGFPGLPERAPNAAAWHGFVATLRARRLDLALQLHGDGRVSNRVVAAFGAARTAGFGDPADGPGFVAWPRTGHEAERLLALLHALGAPATPPRLEFPLNAADRAELARSGLADGLARGGYACLHPGARHAGKRWPVAHFAAVGRALHARAGLALVVTGSAEERALGAELQAALAGVPVVNAAAPLSVGAMAALIEGSRLLVANDTGVSHVAAALGVPSVIVFGNAEVARWAPLDRRRHCVVVAAEGDAVARATDQALALAGAEAVA